MPLLWRWSMMPRASPIDSEKKHKRRSASSLTIQSIYDQMFDLFVRFEMSANRVIIIFNYKTLFSSQSCYDNFLATDGPKTCCP